MENRYRPLLERLECRLVLDNNSISAMYGIHAMNIPGPAPGQILTGNQVRIGQVEEYRSGDPNLDAAFRTHPSVDPFQVYRYDTATSQVVVDTVPTAATAPAPEYHATRVASVMIASGAEPGVLPGARLLSAAHGSTVGMTTEQAMGTVAVTMQHLVTLQPDKAWAINYSAVVPLQPPLDGSSTLTKFVDWSARQHDVLYVVAGNQDQRIGSPKDNYNGMTIAMTKKDGQQVWTTVDPDNQSDKDASGRVFTTLVAPGVGVKTANPATDVFDNPQGSDGTSYAAPHVTGTVALLQEYANLAGWGPNAHRHEVMKAVLLNSADKIKDTTPQKLLLGMEKTILDKDNKNWLLSEAYANDAIPLDDQMGTGQLNAYRARTQFAAAEQNPPPPLVPGVSVMGWDYEPSTGGLKKYPISMPLLNGSYVSITLVWDRVVNLIDGNNNQKYDINETFTASPLADLNLYLMPKGADNLNQAITKSISPVDSVEHMFHLLPAGGDYEIWVQGPAGTPYALAWWTQGDPAGGTSPMSGEALESSDIEGRHPRSAHTSRVEAVILLLDWPVADPANVLTPLSVTAQSPATGRHDSPSGLTFDIESTSSLASGVVREFHLPLKAVRALDEDSLSPSLQEQHTGLEPSWS